METNTVPEPEYSKTFVEYESIKAYFTFSFILDFNNNSLAEFIDQKKKNKWKIIERDNGDGIESDRIGVTPLISIFHQQQYSEYGLYKEFTVQKESSLVYYEYDEEKYIELFPEKKKEDNNIEGWGYLPKEQFKVEFRATCRIFFNGSGCVTFEVKQPTDEQNIVIKKNKDAFKWKADWKKSKMLLSLSKRVTGNSPVSKIKKIDSEQDQFLYDLFTDFIYEEFEKQNDFEIIANCHLRCKEVTNFKPNPYRYLEFGLSPQNPNIYIVLESKEEKGFLENPFEGNNESVHNKNKEIANLLLNVVPHTLIDINSEEHIENVRIPYALRNKKELLKNFSWDNRMFITTYRQLSVLVYSKEKPTNNFIERSMLDAVELIHTRWYFNIILNALLDNEIEQIKGEPERYNIKLLEGIIEKKRLFAFFHHNPISYRYVGGSINDFISEAERDMRLENIKDVTFRKFEIVDKLYETHMEYIRQKSYKELYD